MSTFDEAFNDIKTAKDAIDGIVANQNSDEDKSLVKIQPKDTSKGHFYVSLAKSVIRITAGGALVGGFIVHAGILIIVAEVLGIIEELV